MSPTSHVSIFQITKLDNLDNIILSHIYANINSHAKNIKMLFSLTILFI